LAKAFVESPRSLKSSLERAKICLVSAIFRNDVQHFLGFK